MPIIDGTTAPTFALEGVRFTGFASPSRGATENAVWRVRVEPGTRPAGTHRVTREEVFVALSGTAEVRLGGQALSLSAGSALVVPPDTDFALGNAGAETFEAVCVLPVGGEACLPGQAPFTPPWAR